MSITLACFHCRHGEDLVKLYFCQCNLHGSDIFGLFYCNSRDLAAFSTKPGMLSVFGCRSTLIQILDQFLLLKLPEPHSSQTDTCATPTETAAQRSLHLRTVAPLLAKPLLSLHTSCRNELEKLARPEDSRASLCVQSSFSSSTKA